MHAPGMGSRMISRREAYRQAALQTAVQVIIIKGEIF